MKFHQNRPNRLFIVFIIFWRMVIKWHHRQQTRRILQSMSDHELRDIGLTRSDVGNF